MPLSRHTHTERSTMTEPPWPCIESCTVCGLGESVRIHTYRVRKQLVVLSLLVRSIPEPLVGGWVGPEGFWNLPRLGFFFLFWWFRPNGAEDVRFPPWSLLLSLAGWLPHPSPANACLPDVSYLSDDLLWWQNLISQRQTTESGLLHYLCIRSEFRWWKGVGEISS
jgi:hypothetical protein